MRRTSIAFWHRASPALSSAATARCAVEHWRGISSDCGLGDGLVPVPALAGCTILLMHLCWSSKVWTCQAMEKRSTAPSAVLLA